MSKIGIGIFAILVLSSVGIGMIVAGSDFYMTHPRFRGKRVKITEYGAVLAQELEDGDPTKTPQAEIEEVTFDFGILEPHAISQHDFVIKNTGTATLKLENLGTSCKKCTVAGISRDRVPPGEEAIVTLEWNSGPGPHYSQTATIGTNDATRPAIQLRVEGRVRIHLGAHPEELVLDGIKPGHAATGEVILYSQVTDEVDLGAIQGSRDGFAWEVLPVDAATAEALEAKWARKLIVTTPTDLPSGPLEETIFAKLNVGDADSAREVDFNLRVRGRVKRCLAIYGPLIDDNGLIDVGVVERSVGRKITFKAKVNDDDRRLQLDAIECTPDFLKCSLVPSPGIDPAKGLYDFTIEIPADAPVCNFMPETAMGSLRIVSSHPRIGQVPLAIRFAIRDAGE